MKVFNSIIKLWGIYLNDEMAEKTTHSHNAHKRKYGKLKQPTQAIVVWKICLLLYKLIPFEELHKSIQAEHNLIECSRSQWQYKEVTGENDDDTLKDIILFSC